MTWPFGHLRTFGYGAILADPPWSYKMYSEKGYEKSPEAHYATMQDKDIAALPVGHLAAPDCMLFLWAVWPKLDTAMAVMKAWGFTYKTGGAWHKRTVHGKTAFGPGYIVRTACEPFIIGTIGQPRITSRSVRNLIDAPTRGHSRKPDDMRRNIEKLLPDAYKCELFARESWPNADTWGLEKEKFDGPADPAPRSPAHDLVHPGEA